MTPLAQNIIYNLTGQGLILLLGLIAVRFIFRQLGDDIFGIIFFNLVMTSVLTTGLELGVSATIVREVSTRFDSERDYVRDLIRTASTLYWSIGIFLVAAIWLTAPVLVAHWLNLRSLDHATAAMALRVLSAMALVALPKSLYASICRGRQLMGPSNAIDVSTAAAQQVGILLLLLSGGGLFVVLAWISLSGILGVMAYVVLTARIVGWSALRPSFSIAVVMRNIDFTGHMMVMSALSLIHIQAAQVIVSKLLPAAEFGFYGLVASTVTRASVITSAIAQAAFPSLSKLHGTSDVPQLLRQYRKLQDLASFGTVPMFAGICFAAVPVYTYVFNARVADALLLPAVFLAVGTWLNATLSIPYILSLAMGRPQIAVRLNLYALAVVLPATVALILRFGISGAGLSWVVYNLFAYAYFIPRICRECLKIPLLTWYLGITKVLLVAMVTYGAAWLLVGADHAPTRLLIGAFAAATVAFYAGAFVVMGPDLKATLLRFPAMLALRRADDAPPRT